MRVICGSLLLLAPRAGAGADRLGASLGLQWATMLAIALALGGCLGGPGGDGDSATDTREPAPAEIATPDDGDRFLFEDCNVFTLGEANLRMGSSPGGMPSGWPENDFHDYLTEPLDCKKIQVGAMKQAGLLVVEWFALDAVPLSCENAAALFHGSLRTIWTNRPEVAAALNALGIPSAVTPISLSKDALASQWTWGPNDESGLLIPLRPGTDHGGRRDYRIFIPDGDGLILADIEFSFPLLQPQDTIVHGRGRLGPSMAYPQDPYVATGSLIHGSWDLKLTRFEDTMCGKERAPTTY